MRNETTSSFTAYSRIKRSIIDLTYSPGERLSEVRLADEFGLGRSPIRTALARLEGEGWIEVSPQSGTFVRALSVTEIDELTELRAILEAHCVGLAATRISAKELAALQVAFEEGAPKVRKGDAEAFLDVDDELHTLIYRRAGNELIAETLIGLRDKVQWIRRACVVSNDRVQDGYSEIEGILDALVRRDPGAARERMKQHVENAARFCQMIGSRSRHSRMSSPAGLKSRSLD